MLSEHGEYLNSVVEMIIYVLKSSSNLLELSTVRAYCLPLLVGGYH